MVSEGLVEIISELGQVTIDHTFVPMNIVRDDERYEIAILKLVSLVVSTKVTSSRHAHLISQWSTIISRY